MNRFLIRLKRISKKHFTRTGIGNTGVGNTGIGNIRIGGGSGKHAAGTRALFLSYSHLEASTNPIAVSHEHHLYLILVARWEN